MSGAGWRRGGQLPPCALPAARRFRLLQDAGSSSSHQQPPELQLHPGRLTKPPPHLHTCSFKVINHRADFVFRLLRNGSTLPGQPQPVIVAAESRVVRNTITARPAQGHLALDARGR